MPIVITVDDADLTGFSAPARDGVKNAGEDFIRHVIAEANRLESSQNTGGGPVEITKGMVSDAFVIQRRAVGTKKVSVGIKALRIASAVLSLIVGFMYDVEKLRDTGYMAVFVVFIAVAIFTTTLATLKE